MLLPLNLFLKSNLALLSLFIIVVIPQFMLANNASNTLLGERQRLIEKHEQRILELEQMLDRAHFTKVAMEDNLRNLNVTKESGSGALNYFLILTNVLLLVALIAMMLKRKAVNQLTDGESVSIQYSDPTISKQLTEREMDVLSLIVDLKSNPEISKALFISRNTTKTHVANILKKLEVSCRKEAAQKAQELSLIKSNE